MKNIFRYLASVLVGAMTLAACQQEIVPLGTEISVNPETVSVAGLNAGNETVTVTADGDWIAVAPAWIKVAPANGGAGETTVTLSFADNVEEDGALAAARKGSVLFSVAEVSAELVVEQAGDPDKAPAEVQTITCAEFNAQEDGAGPFRVVGTIVSIKEVSAQYQNATLTINDGTADLYLYRVLAKDGEKIENLGLAVGDKITVEGKKGSYNGSPQMAEKTGVILEVEKSLISVSKVLPENPLALEGEDVMVSLMCKGEGLEVIIPENASWLTVASSEQSGELAVIVLSAAANDGGARKTDVEFVTTFNGTEYKAVVTVEQDGKVIEATIPEFLAAEVSIVVYKVTGTIVRASVSGDYNNADITIADADGNELYVYRMKPAGEANIVDYGLTVGDELTVQGQRAEYNGNPQMGNCVYVSHVDKEDPNAGEEIEVTPITIPELYEKAEAAGEKQTDLSDEVNYELTAVVCGTSENSSYGTVYVMTKGATAAGNGFVLYNSSLEGKYNVGDEIKVTLKAGVAQVSQYNGNSQLSGVTDADVEVVSQNNEVAPVTVAAADLINYLGMPVIVENATVAEGGVWCTENSHGNHKFSASGTEFSVYVNKRATVFQGVEYVAATGNISGIAVTYKGNLQLAPRDMEDVKAFAKTGDVEPADLDGCQWVADNDGVQVLFDFGLAEEGMLSIALPSMDGTEFYLHMAGFYEIEATDGSSGVISYEGYDWEWDEMLDKYEFEYSELNSETVKLVCETVFGTSDPKTLTKVAYPYEINVPGGGDDPQGPVANGWYRLLNNGKVMAPLAAGVTSGNAPASSAVNADENKFQFTYDPDMTGYTVQDVYGRYYGQTDVDYDDDGWGIAEITVSETLPSGDDYYNYLWVVDNSYDDGTADVYNMVWNCGFGYPSADDYWYLTEATYETAELRPVLVPAEVLLPEQEPDVPADPWEGENVVSYDLPESASSSRQVLRNIKYYADESNINIRLVASVSKIAEVPTDGLTISLYDKTDGTVGKGFYNWWNDAKGDVEYNAERCGTITGSALVMSVDGTSIDVQTVVDGDLVTWTFAFPRSANPVMSNDKVYMGILTLDAGWNATGAMPDKYAEMLEVTLP